MHECSERREEVEREERPTRRRSRVIDSWPWKAGEAVEIEREKERERAFSSRSLPLLPALLNPHSLSLSLLPSHPSLRTSCDAVTVPVPQSESSQYITPLSLSLSLSCIRKSYDRVLPPTDDPVLCVICDRSRLVLCVTLSTATTCVPIWHVRTTEDRTRLPRTSGSDWAWQGELETHGVVRGTDYPHPEEPRFGFPNPRQPPSPRKPHPNLAMAIRYSLCRKFSSNLLVRMFESLRALVEFKSLQRDRRSTGI